jgi:hypothetical protein
MEGKESIKNNGGKARRKRSLGRSRYGWVRLF